MIWVPTTNADVERMALPPLRVPVPILVPFFSKVTVPVGVPRVELTMQVKVIVCKYCDGLAEATIVVVVTPLLTVCVRTDELLARKEVLPS